MRKVYWNCRRRHRLSIHHRSTTVLRRSIEGNPTSAPVTVDLSAYLDLLLPNRPLRSEIVFSSHIGAAAVVAVDNQRWEYYLLRADSVGTSWPAERYELPQTLQKQDVFCTVLPTGKYDLPGLRLVHGICTVARKGTDQCGSLNNTTYHR